MIKNKKNLFDSKNVFHDLPVMKSKFKNLLNNTNAIKEMNLASGSNTTDKEGLERASASANNRHVIGGPPYVSGIPFGKFISGMTPSHWGINEFSIGAKDVRDDVGKVPVWGDVKIPQDI